MPFSESAVFGDGRDFCPNLRLSQPIRIASGGFATMLPTTYDYATSSATSTLERFSLSPKGREVDAELSYGKGILRTGWVGINTYLRRQPGHVATTHDDLGAAFNLSLGF